MTGGLLAVHAHPDDETLSTGALLATWAAAGRSVTVVTCTRGEQGEVIGEHLAHLAGDGPALAAHREGELAAALAALGVRDHVFLDAVGTEDGAAGRYVDSGMAWLAPGRAGAAGRPARGAFVTVPVAEAALRLADVIRDRRPEVVVGYEPGGGYGHPDHVHAHRVLAAALDLVAADGPAPVWLWAVTPAGMMRDGLRRLVEGCAPAGLALLDPDGPLPSAALPDDAVDVRVPVRPVLGAVLAAMAAHATQVTAVTRLDGPRPLLGTYALSNAVALPLLEVEGYRFAPAAGRRPVTWPDGLVPTRPSDRLDEPDGRGARVR